MVITKELDPHMRSKLEAGVKLGHSMTFLSKKYNVSRTTIYDTFKLKDLRDRQKTKPHSGRPKKLLERARNHIIIIIKKISSLNTSP